MDLRYWDQSDILYSYLRKLIESYVSESQLRKPHHLCDILDSIASVRILCLLQFHILHVSQHHHDHYSVQWYRERS